MLLNRLLNPKSIAFIGGNECAVAIKRTLELGFKGKIWAVHPKRTELAGIATVKSVEDIDGDIDAAFVAVKREPTIDIVRALKNKNCGGAVIYAAGFAEAGSSELQAELLAAADGMPVLGPNCYGFVNTLSKAALWPDEHGLKQHERGVAIITQSGNIACNFTFTKRALPLVAIFAIGNQADVDIARLLEALAQDDRITAIGLHIEGLKDIPAFAKACEIARLHNKPIIALKTGKSEQGAKTAMSHTSSLSGADDLYDALFLRHGVARINSITAFVEALKFLHHGVLLDSKLVSLSCSGGEAGLAADLALSHAVTFPSFDADTRLKVQATLNEFVNVDNPLDYHTFIWGDEDKLRNTFTAVLSGGFDCGMLILDFPTQSHMDPSAWHKTARAFVDAAKVNNARAAIVSTLPECMPLDLAESLMAQGITPMLNLNDALTVFDAAAMIGRNWAQIEKRPALAAPVVSDGTMRNLNENEAKQLLAEFGLKRPKAVDCLNRVAAEQAAKLGFPVVMKISSDTVLHKSDVGGVILNIRNDAEAEEAADKLSKLGDRVLVEEMISNPVAELIIGLKRDPQFGLALVVGAGGVQAELLRDTVTILLPTHHNEIMSKLRALRCWKLIEGFRGRSGNQEEVYKSVLAITRLADKLGPQLEEVEVNPLLVLTSHCIMVDALVRMRYSK